MKKTFFLIMSGIMMLSCKDDMDGNSSLSGPAGNTSEFITLKSGIVVEKRGDDYIFGGDMILFPSQLKSLEENGNLTGGSNIPKDGADTSLHPAFNIPLSEMNMEGGKIGQKNVGINADPYRLWAMVRFTYGPSILNHPNKDFYQARIRQALQHIQATTNVRFYNATGQPTVDPTWGFAYPYIEINYIGSASASSSSHIGRNPAGGKQELKLADFAFPTWNPADVSTIVHELGHAIGMMHEQNRPDRDNYVNINNANLTNQGKSQFQKVTTNYSYFGSYDFSSIMGYDSFTSSTDHVYNISEPMYTRKDGTYITPSNTLTVLDRIWFNNYHLPYIARSDVYRELDDVVYKTDNTVMTASERLQLQAQLNNGNPNPPAGGRIPNNL
ncbi:MAG: M12 family metallopeptidase [Chryseobacterium sp.]|uniref:M12 family metallopeptidase n=1 Tax=Chryseobacterium sp. TaxID=1871047 RepID=UPI0025BEF5B0|nr:M12 family metallopeptidase [Chryseobacterium sp.]MCJ7935747.1 M12 family metallopeptidase [Chryseobacterium sp.]